MSATAVTATLKEFAHPIVDWQPGVQDMRQILLAFARHHCRPIEELMEPGETENIRGLQAGHTVATERQKYGVSNEILNNAVAEEIMPKFLAYSTDMHRVLAVTPGASTL